nr:uncharacterized protein LOC117688895 [Crassostrea gigas]
MIFKQTIQSPAKERNACCVLNFSPTMGLVHFFLLFNLGIVLCYTRLDRRPQCYNTLPKLVYKNGHLCIRRFFGVCTRKLSVVVRAYKNVRKCCPGYHGPICELEFRANKFSVY